VASYYETAVYTPKLVEDATGAQDDRKGFASAIAGEAKRELAEKARRKGMSQRDIDRADEQLLEVLTEWASVVPDSDEDAYDWEVREPGEDGHLRLKYVIKPDAFNAGKLDGLLAPQATAPVATFPAGAPGMPGMPPPLGATPPPLGMPPPLVEHQYHLGIGGQQFGPYTAQQIVQMVQTGQVVVAGTKVWRAGLAAWGELGQLPELTMLFAAPAPASPPPLPPML
jgi:hypothetical protein